MHTFTRRALLDTMCTTAAAGLLAAPAGAGGQTTVPAGRRIIAFDVNETLLDVGALAPRFERLFGSAAVAREWFSNVVLYSQVTAIAGPYADFGAIARAVLEMTAAAHRVDLAPGDRDDILGGLVSLPAHRDAPVALGRLRRAGFRLVTLTNSAPAAVARQMAHAGLADYFERSFSVDAVRTFKPAAEVYRFAARELGVEPRDLRLVAAHAWDIVGAMRAGCAAAFVSRPGKALYPLANPPDIVESDLDRVAERIVALDSPG